MSPFARAAQGLGAEFSRVGGQILAAGVARALEEIGRVTEEADRRVKRGAQRADKIARGEPIDSDD